MPRRRKRIIDIWSAVMLFALMTLNAALWHAILGVRGAAPGIYPLSSAKDGPLLIVLPGGATLMIDAGADADAAAALQKILSGGTRIDLGMITAGNEKRYGGYAYLLDHYTFGAFVYNGRGDIANTTDWKALVAKMAAMHIPLITVGSGDVIRSGTGTDLVITAPDAVMAHSANASDTRIIFKVVIPK